jgi:hypothetical protein
VSQSSEFCRHNPLRCFSTRVVIIHFVIDSVRKLMDTPSYAFLTKITFSFFVYFMTL